MRCRTVPLLNTEQLFLPWCLTEFHVTIQREPLAARSLPSIQSSGLHRETEIIIHDGMAELAEDGSETHAFEAIDFRHFPEARHPDAGRRALPEQNVAAAANEQECLVGL